MNEVVVIKQPHFYYYGGGMANAYSHAMSQAYEI